MDSRGIKIGAGERNRKTRHLPQAPSLHGGLTTGRRGTFRLYCQTGGIANENRRHIRWHGPGRAG